MGDGANKALSRRVIIAGVASGLGLATASANPVVQPLLRPKYAPRIHWGNVIQTDMSALIGDWFWGMTDDGTRISMRLQEVEAVDFGPAYPKHLERREGLINIFASGHAGWFSRNGGQTMLVGHKQLGQSRAYVKAIPRRSGIGNWLEISLN